MTGTNSENHGVSESLRNLAGWDPVSVYRKKNLKYVKKAGSIKSGFVVSTVLKMASIQACKPDV